VAEASVEASAPAGTKTPLMAALLENQAMVDMGLITPEEAEARRRVLLELPKTPAAEKAAEGTREKEGIVSIDTAVSRSLRNIAKDAEAWIGTQDQPILAGDLFRAVRCAPDETTRVEFQLLRSKDKLHAKVWAWFGPLNGAAVTPEQLVGTHSCQYFVRAWVWKWLIQAAAIWMTHLASRNNSVPIDREAVKKYVIASLSEEDGERVALDVLAVVQQMQSVGAQVSKHLALQSSDAKVGEKRPRAPSSPPAQKSTEKLCYTCGGRGHMANVCPSKKKTDAPKDTPKA
jgi:hypothetical protein